MKTVNRLCYILIIIIFISCTTNDKAIKTNTSEIYIDSIEGDFNFDGKEDILKIEKIHKKLRLNIYENKSLVPVLSLKNVFFDIGDLKPTSDFITLSFQNGTIVITQEYGSQNPDGWFISYIKYKKNFYIVDSISDSKKDNLNNLNIKTKVVNERIDQVNFIKEFNKL